MEPKHDSDSQALSHRQSRDLSRLILKLRWIGLEDEAVRLQTVVSTLRPDDRGSVSFGPFSTD